MQLTLWHIVQPSSSKYRTMRVPRFYLWSLEESSLAEFDLFFVGCYFLCCEIILYTLNKYFGFAEFEINHKVIFDYLFKSSYMPV